MAYVPKRKSQIKLAAKPLTKPSIKSENSGQFTSVNALARELGLSSTMVSRHLNRGLTVDQVRSKYKKQEDAGVKKAHGGGERKTERPELGHTQPRASQGGQVWVTDDQTGEMRLENEYEAKARKERALATEREIRVAQALQTLIPRVQVDYVIGGALVRLRDMLSRMSVEMRDALASETDPIKVGVLVDEATEHILSDVQMAIRRLGTEVGKVEFETEVGEAAA
jgi:hypothetical protein